MSLLEKAKAIKVSAGRNGKFDNDEVAELALAWLRDDITLTQVKGVVGNNNPYNALCTGLRRALRQGKLKEVGK